MTFYLFKQTNMELKVGDRVVISPESAFYNEYIEQSSQWSGEIMLIKPADLYPYKIERENGIVGWYNKSDLALIYPDEPMKIEFEIGDRVSLNPKSQYNTEEHPQWEGWLGTIVDIVSDSRLPYRVERDNDDSNWYNKKDLVREITQSSNKFKVGDRIVMTAAANDQYNITKEGSTWIITELKSNTEARVKFDNLETYCVYLEHMQLETKPKQNPDHKPFNPLLKTTMENTNVRNLLRDRFFKKEWKKMLDLIEKTEPRLAKLTGIRNTIKLIVDEIENVIEDIEDAVKDNSKSRLETKLKELNELLTKHEATITKLEQF